MGTIDWDAFLKGWQGQPPTSPTSSSESELLPSNVKNEEPLSSKPSAKPLIRFSLESAGPGLTGHEVFSSMPLYEDMDALADSPPSPKTDKDQQPDE